MGAIDGTITMAANRIRPLAVSKATSNMDEIVNFYEKALFAKMEWNVSYADGTKYTYWNPGFSSMADKMQVRFVERKPSWTSGELSVEDLEALKMSGHKMVADTTNSSANIICGFDKWYDNHYSIDGGYTTLDEYVAAFNSYKSTTGSTGWPYYQAWGGSQGP
jgi:hypothetical protein